MKGPLPGLPDGHRFDLIVADPPWRFQARSAKGITAKSAGGQYRTMSLEDIKALPVADLAAADCLLWLWATNPMLPAAFEVLAAWGFTFKTAGHWVKTTRHGRLRAGFEFDVPVRFDTDMMDVTLDVEQHGSIPSIPLIELRLPQPPLPA